MHKNNIYYRVYKLVANLTTNERMYIKKSLSGERPNQNVLTLYSNLCMMKSYDEAEIRSLFKDAIKASTAASTLIKTIAKILQYYTEDNLQKVKVLNYIARAEILVSKDSVELSKQMAEEGLQLAEKLNYNLGIMDFNLWHLNGMIRHPDFFTAAEIKQHYHSIKNQLLLFEQKAYSIYTAAVLKSLHKDYLVPIDGIEDINLQIRHFNTGSKSDITHFNIDYINIMYLFYIGEWEEAKEKCEALFKKTYSEEISSTTMLHYGSLIFLVQLSLLLNKNEEYRYYKHIMQDITERNVTSAGGVVYYKYFLKITELYFSSINNEKQNNSHLIEEVEETAMDKTQSNRHNNMIIYICYHFFSGSYNKVLSIITREVNDSDFKTYQKSYVYLLRWIELICYYEINEKQLFTTKAGMLKRFVEKHREIHMVEYSLLHFLKKNIGKKVTAEEADDILHIFDSHKKWVRSAFSYFNLFRWLSAKK